jgi:hypothetical protein
MKTRLKKLFAYATKHTALKNCENDDERAAVERHFLRAAYKLPLTHFTVRQWLESMRYVKLKSIGDALPRTGYSMGEQIYVQCGRYTATSDRRMHYPGGKYKPTHGCYRLTLTHSEFLRTSVIGGLVTTIAPKQTGKVKACSWYVGHGEKKDFRLVKQDGFVCGTYHAATKKVALDGHRRILANAKRASANAKKYLRSQARYAKMHKKALNMRYSFADSIEAGNCEAGTKAFALRCRLDMNKAYKGSYLLSMVDKYKLSTGSFVERMIRLKTHSLLNK